MQRYTSSELSKKLWDNGCKLEQEIKYFFSIDGYFMNCEDLEWSSRNFTIYPSYDIIWDICIKYQENFFKKEDRYLITNNIFERLKNNFHYEEIEKYIWANCLFNPNNRG